MKRPMLSTFPFSKEGTEKICFTLLLRTDRVCEPGGLPKLNLWDWPEKYPIHGEVLELALKLHKTRLQKTSKILIQPAKETQNWKHRGKTD